MKLESGDKVVLIGDSITDCGRMQPVAEGLFDPLGRGYVTFVNALIGAVYPKRSIRIINVGTSGNTIRDLDGRWQKDVLDRQPTWVSCMIGTNDVWRQFDSPNITESQVYSNEFASTYARLLEQTRPRVKGIILLTPFYVELNLQDAMRMKMDEYGGIVRGLASRFDAIFVDTQAAFDRWLGHHHSSAIAWDRIHPNQTGHMIIARAFLDAIGFEW